MVPVQYYLSCSRIIHLKVMNAIITLKVGSWLGNYVLNYMRNR